MERLEELRGIFKDCDEAEKKVLWPLLDDVVFLESRLRELRRLPMLRVHPKNPARQEVTPAGKQYKEFMQSYTNVIKVLERAIRKPGEGAASPLSKLLAEFTDDES